MDWYNTPLYLDDYPPEIAAAALDHQLAPALLRAMMHAESAFNPKALSNTCAAGLIQFMPATATEVAVKKIWHQQQNI